MEPARSEAFERLRPLCVSLTKEHTIENAKQLLLAVKNVNPLILQDLQEYVLFPLRFISKQHVQSHDRTEDLLIEVCNCMQVVLTNTCVNRWEMFQDIFTCLTCLLSPPERLTKNISSEELKLAIIKAYTSLLINADLSMIQSLYSPSGLPPLGHAVSVLLKFSEFETSRDIQLASLDCLLHLSRADMKGSKKQKAGYGDVFASFLPGIALTVSRIITGDQKQGYTVLSKGLEVWWKIVCLVLGDSSLLEAGKKNETTEKVRDKVRVLMVERSADWIKATGSKLLVLIRQIAKIKTHTNWRVRNALVEWADSLLQHCMGSLSESVPALLETLVGMIADDYLKVSSKSKRALKVYRSRLDTAEKVRPLTEILEENLHSLSISLPRLIRMADEDEKLCVVNLLNGYLHLLGENINTVLRSLTHLRCLSLALIQTVELNCRDLKIVEQRTLNPGFGVLDSDQTVIRPRKVFKYFRDDNIATALMKSCHLLGYYGDLNILSDHFLDIFNESSVHRMSATLILNEVVYGSCLSSLEDINDTDWSPLSDKVAPSPRIDSASIVQIVSAILDEYLSPTNFNLQTQADAKVLERGGQDSINVATLNKNICQLSLYLEGIGRFALVLGSEFTPLLINILYPLLEKLGNENSMICQSSYVAILDICKACSFPSIADIIQRNTDYLMNAISLRLRKSVSNSQTTLVLIVMLQYSDQNILPLISDTVNEILSSVDDNYHEEAVVFMKVLLQLTKAVNRWFPWKQTVRLANVTKPDLEQESNTPRETSTADEVKDFFLEYHRQKTIADGNVTEEDYADVMPDEEEADASDVYNDKKPDLPTHIVVVKEVLVRTKHLLSSSNPRLRLLVLEVIGQAAVALSSWKNELLPLLHQLWQPFSYRFTDEEKLVIIKAIQTLETLCLMSGDFLRKRIFKDVVPKLNGFLRKQAKISEGSAHSYQMTVAYNLQLTCLINLGEICRLVEAQEVDVDAVAAACQQYLSCRQPKSLQEACIKTYRSLILLEPDAMWLKLSDLYMPCELSPPGPEFKSPKLLKPTEQKNDFTDNVQQLLAYTWM